MGARSVGCSGKSDDTLLRLPWRPIEPLKKEEIVNIDHSIQNTRLCLMKNAASPGPGVDRSGIGGGGPLIDDPRE